MNWGLPTTVQVQGVIYDIRTDYRCVLDICAALGDPELDKQEKAFAALTIFYPEFDDMPSEHYEDALKQIFLFINGGKAEEDAKKKMPRLVDWEQDYPLIIAPVNKVLGQEIRAIPYDAESNIGGLHWFTFLAAYQEIGDCTFAQVVRIRDHLARGKPLDKQDREWYRRNRELVDFKAKYTSAEEELLKEWGGQ